ASRPCGRYAVGLRPSLDPAAYFDAPSQDQEAPKQAKANAAVVLTGPAPSGMTGPAPSGMTCAPLLRTVALARQAAAVHKSRNASVAAGAERVIPPERRWWPVCINASTIVTPASPVEVASCPSASWSRAV
ncbi:MAG TPA: hypothetical protein VLZ05_26650, partial [Mycobacterium sp.]